MRSGITISVFTVYSPKVFGPVSNLNWIRTTYHSHISIQVDELLHKAHAGDICFPIFSSPGLQKMKYKVL
jgi:hypothetical protein